MLDFRAAALALSLAILAAPCSTAAAAPLPVAAPAAPALLLVQSPPQKKTCRREPIWGFRISALCKPSGICNDRVIKGYRTVCT